jgi:acetolactate synthase-1/2/3 large subunit
VRLARNERLQPKCAAIPQSDGTIISMPLEDMTPLIPLSDLKAIMREDLSEQSIMARK